MIKHVDKILIILFAAITCIGFSQFVMAESNTAEPTQPKAEASGASTNKEVIKKIDEKASEAKEELKKKTQEGDVAKAEAERALREKLELEKETQLKTQEAELAKKEAQALKKEAIIDQNPEAIKEAREIEQKAQELEKEARLSQEKLKVLESKANLAQEKLVANAQIIEQLESELEVLRKVRISKLTWGEKFLRVGIALTLGILALFIFGVIIGRTKHISNKRSQQMLSKGIVRESESALRTKTLANLFAWIGYLAIFGLMSYFVLDGLGFDVAPLLAGAGIVGLAFGFGGQYLIQDIISGIFILLEGQIRINDVVKIGEYGGLVEDVNLRITTLRDLEGRVIVVPNGEIKTLVNYTKEFAYALLNIGVAYKEDPDNVIHVIKDVGAELKKDTYFKKLILEDLEMLGVDSFDDSQVTIKCRIKTLPIKQWEVAREFRRWLKKRFDEVGIEIPFPHRTLYWGVGSENDWFRNLASNQIQPE